MRKISTFIVKQRLWITIVFALCMVASAVGAFFVEVNYADTVYLPSDSSLKQGLDAMYAEFGEGGNATVMLSGAEDGGADSSEGAWESAPSSSSNGST